MIKPISTAAYGCFFRSRLEARFAVFFTKAQWEWQYEPEGFELPSGWYLPDFWVLTPEGGRFVEIKQFEPTELERIKAQELSDHTGQKVWVLSHQWLVHEARHGKFKNAAIAAISQRFEFGESPC